MIKKPEQKENPKKYSVSQKKPTNYEYYTHFYIFLSNVSAAVRVCVKCEPMRSISNVKLLPSVYLFNVFINFFLTSTSLVLFILLCCAVGTHKWACVCLLKSLFSFHFTISLSFSFNHAFFLFHIYYRILHTVNVWLKIEMNTKPVRYGKGDGRESEEQRKYFFSFGKFYAKSTDTHKYCSMPVWHSGIQGERQTK